MRVDVAGNVWSSAGDGVHCFAPDGTLLGKILVPETVANLCFGGKGGHSLFITATTSVYCVFVDIKGAEPWTRSRQI
jgi:gluconolactonase